MVRLILCLAVMFLTVPAEARVGRVINLRGEATLTRSVSGEYSRVNVERGMRVQEGDQLRTRNRSSIRIVFEDRSLLNIGENSSIVVQRYRAQNGAKKRKVGIKIWAGSAWARVTKWLGGGENRFEVHSPNAVAGVRGTEFSVSVETDGATEVTVFEGVVDVGLLEDQETNAITTLLEGQRSRLDSEGKATKQTVAPDQLAQERQRAQGVGASGGEPSPIAPAEAPRVETQRDSQPEFENDAAPPLDLDPASGQSRVRGRVEFRP